MNSFQFYCHGDVLKGFKEKNKLANFVFKITLCRGKRITGGKSGRRETRRGEMAVALLKGGHRGNEKWIDL